MATGSGPDSAWQEQLSALADGELADAAPLCSAWRTRAEVREAWHTYHLIGDVLRSEDLAGAPARDAALLGRLRERLAAEPTVLAPEPLPTVAQERRWSLRAAMVVTAGVLAVGGVYGLISRGGADPIPPVAIANPPAPPPAPVVPAAARDPDPIVAVDNARLIRDARLDAYLAAHKQFAGSSALGMAPSLSRSASLETTAPGR